MSAFLIELEKYMDTCKVISMPTISLTREEAVIVLQHFQELMYKSNDPRIVNVAKKIIISLRKDLR